MKGQSVVKRYALALYEAASDASRIDDIEEDILTLDRLFSEIPELKTFCLSSGAPDTREKTSVFVKTAFLPYLSEFAGRTVGLIEKHRRLEALPYLAERLRDIIDEHRGVMKVAVQSAGELTAEVKKDITAHLEKRLGQKVRPVWQLKPELLGGLTFQWNNYLLDFSIRGRLKNLKYRLKQGT